MIDNKGKAFMPLEIKGKRAKNRFIRSAVNDHLGNLDGSVSDAEIEMYDTLGRGEIGVVITGHMSVSPSLDYRADIAQLSIGDEDKIEGLKRIADKIHEYESLAIAQISLAGPKGLTPFDYNELSTEQMEEIRDWFIKAAIRAKKAGFDGVQIHIAHWYFLQAVCTTDLNHRGDQYGGSPENQIRLPREIVEGIVVACGKDFIIMAKMNAHNTLDGVDDYEILIDYVRELVGAGLDLVEVSGRDFTQKGRKDQLYYLDAVRELRKKFPNLLLSPVGGIYTKEAIEEALTISDFVSLGRTLLTQPDFIIQLKNGSIDHSRCLHCNKCFEIFSTKYERCVFGPINPKLVETFSKQ